MAEKIHFSVGVEDLKRLQESLDEVSAKSVAQAHAMALTRAMTTGEAYAAKFFQESYPQVKQALIKKKYINQYINKKSSKVEDIVGVLEISGRGMSLENLGAKKTKTGARYKGAGHTVEVKGAFFAKVYANNYGPHWWKRETNERFPVKFLYGPSPFTVFKFEKNQEAVAEIMRDRYLEEIPRQLNFYMQRAFNRLIGYK